MRHLATPTDRYQPSNVTFALLPPIEFVGKKCSKEQRGQLMAERAFLDLESFWSVRRGDVETRS
jgi:methylenetetrahydrofolate--tRNA-(uracil-5-)-methyltransferase